MCMIIYILGDGGFAKELKAYYDSTIESYNYKINLIPKKEMKKFNLTFNPKIMNHHVILGSGKCDIKDKMLDQFKHTDTANFVRFVSKRASVYGKIHDGSVIAPGAVIAPNSVIGRHVLINYNATIGHDTIIGDLSTVSPNASIGGKCIVGSKVYVGSGAQIRENLTIVDNVTIGMGAVVTKDLTEPGTYLGVPARRMPKWKNKP